MRSFRVFISLVLLPLALASAPDWSAIAAHSNSGIIRLNSESYDQLLTPDRDYSVSVVLTALPAQFKCQPCQEFDPSFNQVAASWRRVPKYQRDQHFFAQLDFIDGQAVYQRLGLSSAPTMQFHPAPSGPNKSNKLSVITYDLNRNGLTAPPFHSWISHLTPIPFELYKPFNPFPMLMRIVPILAAIGMIYGAWPYLVPFLQSRIIWGTLSIVTILIFTSGHMWNKIKNAPYVAMGEGGKVSWIAAGFQNQLAMETQVVAGIYGLLGFSIVALTSFVPAQSNPTKQRIGVYLWLGILLVVFSILMRLFKVKNGSYPYKLLF